MYLSDIRNILSISDEIRTVGNNLIGINTDQYGIVDLIIQIKLSWVQFLKRLSLTDLDQDSETGAHSCIA